MHPPHSNFAFALDRRHFVVRLRTAKDDVEKVELVIGNQYLWQTRQEFPMEKIGQDELFDYWRCVYPMDDPRLGYYFLLHKGTKRFCIPKRDLPGRIRWTLTTTATGLFTSSSPMSMMAIFTAVLPGSTVLSFTRFSLIVFVMETRPSIRKTKPLGANCPPCPVSTAAICVG